MPESGSSYCHGPSSDSLYLAACIYARATAGAAAGAAAGLTQGPPKPRCMCAYVRARLLYRARVIALLCQGQRFVATASALQ
eukprot:2232437-Prymnesium_polylepis.1